MVSPKVCWLCWTPRASPPRLRTRPSPRNSYRPIRTTPSSESFLSLEERTPLPSTCLISHHALYVIPYIMYRVSHLKHPRCPMCVSLLQWNLTYLQISLESNMSMFVSCCRILDSQLFAVKHYAREVVYTPSVFLLVFSHCRSLS